MQSNEHFSEQYRLAAETWTALDAAASLLEELKSATLSQRMMMQGEKAVSRAEMEVKASPYWTEYVTKMIETRKQANLAKVKCEFLRMKYYEGQSAQANQRTEMRMLP
jgi:hypothetical protein